MADYQIEIANLKDLRDLHHLEHECFEMDAWPLIDLMMVLTWPGIVRLKAVVDGSFAGFVAGDAKTTEQVGWITTIGVFEKYRRQGIASALLAECETRMGMPRVRLSVRRSNFHAIAMYAKFGYQQLETWPAYYNGGEDALVLQKRR